MFQYTHPLVNEGAGRIKSDPVNEARINQVLNNYRQSNKEKFEALQAELPLTQKVVHNSQIIFPAVGFVVGLLASQAFVHANSKYIGKFLTLATTYGGYWLSKCYWRSYNAHKFFTQYPYYPSEIQKMIDNNDARYAHQWLNRNPQ